MPLRKSLRAIFTALMMTPILGNAPVYAQAQNLIQPTQSGRVNSLLTVFENLVFKLGDINRKYGDHIENANDAVDAIETTMTAFAGDPLILDQSILDDIRSDTANLTKLGSVTPELKLFTPEEYEIMKGTDIAALREVYEKIEQRYDAYENLYERWQEKRAQAVAIADGANAAYSRGVQFEEALADVMTTMPSSMLNAVYRFDYLWLDVATILNRDLAERAFQADRLKGEYDRSVAEMKANLDKAEPLKQSIDFFQLQDAIINNSPEGLGPKTEDTSSLEEALMQGTPGLEALEDAQNTAQAANNIPAQSVATAFLQTLLEEARVSNELVREYVASLFRQADQQDREAAMRQQMIGMINMSMNFAQSYALSQNKTPAAPTSGSNGFQYQYRDYQWGTNTDGTAYFKFLDITLGAPSTNSPPNLQINQGETVQMPQP